MVRFGCFSSFLPSFPSLLSPEGRPAGRPEGNTFCLQGVRRGRGRGRAGRRPREKIEISSLDVFRSFARSLARSKQPEKKEEASTKDCEVEREGQDALLLLHKLGAYQVKQSAIF